MANSIVDILRGGTDPTQLKLDSITNFISNVQNILYALAAGYTIVGLILASYQYLTSFGDDAKATKAKNTIKWVVIGVVIIILSKVIIYEIQLHVVNAPPNPSIPPSGP